MTFWRNFDATGCTRTFPSRFINAIRRGMRIKSAWGPTYIPETTNPGPKPHLFVGHFEQLERGLLEVRDGALDLLGIHLVLVGQLVPHLGDLLLHLGHLLGVQLVLVLLHLGLGVVQDALGLFEFFDCI